MQITRINKSVLVINRFGKSDNTATAANLEASDLGFTKRPTIVKHASRKGVTVERRTYIK